MSLFIYLSAFFTCVFFVFLFLLFAFNVCFYCLMCAFAMLLMKGNLLTYLLTILSVAIIASKFYGPPDQSDWQVRSRVHIIGGLKQLPSWIQGQCGSIRQGSGQIPWWGTGRQIKPSR